MLGENQERSLRNLYAVLGQLIKDHHLVDSLPQLKLDVAEALSLMERDFPVSIQVR